MLLKNKVAVITGASMGIGKAIAAALLREGCSGIAAARGRDALDHARHALSGGGGRIEVYTADVSSPQEAGALFQFALKVFGRLDILVNSAGIYGPIGPAADADPAEWLRTLEINLFGTFLCTQQALRILIRQGTGGKILNLAGGGASSAFPFFSAYAASKAAVVRFTETVAREVLPHRIDVNAIAPGAVNTRLLDQVLRAGDLAGLEFHQRALRQKDEGGTPPERTADLAVFLASSASDGLTGRFISAVWDDWQHMSGRIPAIAASDLYMLRRTVPEATG